MPDRRKLLRGAAIAAGGAAVWGAVPGVVQRAMAIPANSRTGTLMDVEHIVVFMQENRAFDHYFGLLDGVRGYGDPHPLRLPNGHSVWRQPSPQHPDGYVMPFYGDSRSTNAYVVDGAGQGHDDNLTILNGGRYDRWGATGELHKRMAHYAGRDLPYYHALANAFTVCDAYHCSTLTQTYPNRLHLWTGCNGGGQVGGEPIMSNYGEDQTPTSDQATDQPIPGGPLTWTTYAERLETAGVSWKVYQEYDNFQDNILSVFAPFRPAPKDSPLYQKGRSWVSESDPNPENVNKSNGDLLVAAFRRDLAAGTLPQVSWIVTAQELSEHPSAPPANGENVCARLIEALVDHPDMFAKTVYIIYYDEAGGFFDHMPPPTPPIGPGAGFSTVPVAGEIKTYGPNDPHPGQHPIGLGIRTPAIIVSPWSRGGFVCSQLFDHTSVLRLMEARFGVEEPNISDWRRAVSGDLTACFDFKTPNRDWTNLTLPGTQDFLERVNRSKAATQLTIPAAQAPTHQTATPRPSRPLPYAIHADARTVAGRLTLDLINEGQVGAVFQVHDESGAEGPWTFTIGKNDRYAASPWTHPAPVLIIHGPDGFYRRFGAAPLEAVLRTDTLRGGAALKLTNTSAKPQRATIALARAYGGDRLAPRTVRLAPGDSASEHWPLAASHGWYDLTVTLEGAADQQQRFAGRFHNGRPGLTDPGIGQMVL
ncbi:MAG: phospholipase C, phosphocholine-specific [Caulobacteraceae bacterium]|nr:phospholipase C, phosphocholine-specific [Caulobacteraceae bacterium]